MLEQNERTWRNRLPPTAGTGARAVERCDTADSTGVEDFNDATGAAVDYRSCPLCEFDGAEYDDVYFHLMTVHRKSTISSVLLDRD